MSIYAFLFIQHLFNQFPGLFVHLGIWGAPGLRILPNNLQLIQAAKNTRKIISNFRERCITSSRTTLLLGWKAILAPVQRPLPFLHPLVLFLGLIFPSVASDQQYCGEKLGRLYRKKVQPVTSSALMWQPTGRQLTLG